MSHTHDNLIDGLINEEYVDYVINHTDFLDDGELDVYVDESLHPSIVKFTKRLVSKVNKFTETDILINNNESESDILIHDVENYDDRPGLENAHGVQYWENGKSHVTLLEDLSQPSLNKKGRARVSEATKYVITHEFFHGLGLGHPFGNGNHSEFDSTDTVMSYNQMGNRKSSFPMTQNDIEAITQIW